MVAAKKKELKQEPKYASLADKIWRTLSVIDVSKHVVQKHRFSYLSWTWAWSTLMQYFPSADYKFSDRQFEDGTMEIQCTVEIGEGSELVSRFMWLPVMDNNKKSRSTADRAIANPNSVDINTAKMRCLVKCLAMFGLGFYIYAGDDLPTEVAEANDEDAEAQEAAFKQRWGDVNEALCRAHNYFLSHEPDNPDEVWNYVSKELVRSPNIDDRILALETLGNVISLREANLDGSDSTGLEITQAAERLKGEE